MPVIPSIRWPTQAWRALLGDGGSGDRPTVDPHRRFEDFHAHGVTVSWHWPAILFTFLWLP